jgi:hypothetical protein
MDIKQQQGEEYPAEWYEASSTFPPPLFRRLPNYCQAALRKLFSP